MPVGGEKCNACVLEHMPACVSLRQVHVRMCALQLLSDGDLCHTLASSVRDYLRRKTNAQGNTCLRAGYTFSLLIILFSVDLAS